VLATFVIKRPLAGLIAFVAVVVPLVAAHWLVATRKPRPVPGTSAWRRRGLNALVIGTDGRASTSKVQAVLWTLAVFFAIAFMLAWGRSLGCNHAATAKKECTAAATGRTSFDAFVNRGLQPEYYILLGIPVTVAVAAKAITSAKVDDGTLTKPTLMSDQERKGGVVQALRETVSNDAGETDLLDFQYFAFNLLMLAFFFSQFLTKPFAGLPDLPPTLLALSGVSAAAYTTKKGLTTDPPNGGPSAGAAATTTAAKKAAATKKS
jgi:hypothetical protein